LEKAATMAQARREPRFSEIELLPPVQGARAAAHDGGDVSDAVFETLPPQAKEKQATRPSPSVQSESNVLGLGLLKQNTGSHAAPDSQPAGITPGFAAFTILAALSVFWLCGGHALLY
jgi:hypothetical protein